VLATYSWKELDLQLPTVDPPKKWAVDARDRSLDSDLCSTVSATDDVHLSATAISASPAGDAAYACSNDLVPCYRHQLPSALIFYLSFGTLGVIVDNNWK